MSLPVDSIVSVQILVSPAAPTARGFGTALILGQATILQLYRRVNQYANLTEVAVDFASNTEEYKAAAIFFSQSPAPQKVKIGRRFLAAQAGTLRGGTVSSTVATYTGVTNGGFDISIDGTNRQVTAINASAATTMAQVATAIQTRLAVVLASTTCTWDAVLNKFIITSPTTGPTSIVLTAVAPTGGGSPTDASALFGFTVGTGAKSVNGIAIESQTAALDASAVFDPDFYFLTCTAAASVQDLKDSMAWTEANVREFFYTSNDTAALSLNDTSNLFYYAKNLSYRRSFGQYSSGSPYAAVSAMARASVVDFDQPNSTITLMFKQEPGINVESITSAQVSALHSYNANVLIDRGGFFMIEDGKMASGVFQDEVHGLDWYQATLQNAAFSLLATAATKIPQTDVGAAQIVGVLNQASEKARANGLLAAGATWKGANTGEVKTNDILPLGYYFIAGRVADMLQADKDARKSPPITGICIGAGAIHSVAIQVTFQR